MTDTPLVSVVVPVHNGEATIRTALESILRQTYSEFELLVIDDGSTDSTPELLEDMSRRDRRVRVLRNPSAMGLGWTLNRGVAEARGDWIARMDADDVAHPERLMRQLRALQADPSIHVLGTQAVEVDAAGRARGVRRVPLAPEDVRAVLPWTNPIVHPSVMFRREVILSVGSYDPSLRHAEDYDLWLRCAAAGVKMANLPDMLLWYRVTRSLMKKRGWAYRRTEMRVRWRGYRLLRAKPWERVGVLLPLFFYTVGLFPDPIVGSASRLMTRVDPRHISAERARARSGEGDRWP